MHLQTPLLLLAALTTTATARLTGFERRNVTMTDAVNKRQTSSGGGSWTQTPQDGGSEQGFGKKTTGGGSGVGYTGNTGDPWGSNIISISESDAPKYKNVLQLNGQNKDPWTVVFWNKAGPDGKLDGWYGQTALQFNLSPGETKYVAVQDDSRGGFGAAPGGQLPKDQGGGYASTWGEFDFSSSGNNGWSGYDVSMIQAQSAGKDVQGMKICQEPGDKDCSSVSTGGKNAQNAYSKAQAAAGGIGGNISGGPVRLGVTIGYEG